MVTGEMCFDEPEKPITYYVYYIGGEDRSYIVFERSMGSFESAAKRRVKELTERGLVAWYSPKWIKGAFA
jgi:hypothetical protein